MLTELDRNARAILLTVKDLLREQGQAASFGDAVRYLAHEVGIEPSASHLEAEMAKENKEATEDGKAE